MPRAQPSSAGFTLTELAIVLLIVSLLVGGLLIPLSTQRDVRNASDTQNQLKEAQDALMGFAIINGYFPCPAPIDLSTAGLEGPRTGGACNQRVGFLPWATLGGTKLDSWGHFLRYSVTPNFSNTSKFTLSSAGDITIKTRSSDGTQNTLASNVPAAIISFGKQANWAYNEDGTRVADGSATNADEDINGNGDGTNFFSRTASAQGLSGGEFDDMVVWVAPYPLFNRMIASGKLP